MQQKVVQLQQELQELRVSAVYRHKTVQNLQVLLSEDQLDDNYITLPGICDINS